LSEMGNDPRLLFNKSFLMKFPWTLVTAMVTSHLLLVATETNALTPSASDELSNRWSTNDGVIQERLERIQLPFKAKYSSEVRYYIKDYVTTGYRSTEGILGRSLLYFPIFEHYLTINDLPKELMYLPIIESALDPTAKSPVGAAGLWQIMASTARDYGLRIDNYVDERLDPYRSTEAAVNILSDLHRQFGDWQLVLAAYNCGPGRVQQAIRAASCTDYEEVQKYLPKQTQRYVPAFVAAAYVVNHYNDHNLRPSYPTLNVRETRAIKVYEAFSLQEIASACGLAPSTVKFLNPGYVRNYVPASDKKGSYISIPAGSAKAFKDFLAGKTILKGQSIPDDKFRSTYVVAKGDRIENLANLFKCSVEDIVKWNNLSSTQVFVNQELIVYLPSELSKRA